jgi:transcriptional regulator PpsR
MSRGAKPTPANTPLLPSELDAEQTQRLIDAAGDIALVLDGDGVVLDVRAHDRELQKTAKRAWVGKLWAETVTIDSRDKVADLLARALADQPGMSRQVNHPASAGPDLPVLYNAVRVAGAASGARGSRSATRVAGESRAATRVAGESRAATRVVGESRAATRVVALGRDLRDNVTLQRRLVDAQQTMERDYWRFREADTRYRNLFQVSAEAVLIADGTTLRIVEANPAALHLLGGGAVAKAPKIVGAPLASLFSAQAGDPLAAAVAAARSLGKHERVLAELAATRLGVAVSLASFRQEQASFLLVRLAPLAAAKPRRGKADAGPAAKQAWPASGFESAFVRHAADALAFTDSGGRVVAVNRAFARLAELSSEEQARGEPLDRWLGRTGVEMSVLLANLRDSGAAGLFSTELRGALGLVTEVEIAASALDAGGGPAAAGKPAFAFAVRDVGRRLAPNEQALPTKVPASVAQLTELVGRVPLKQIVAETSDLIERLSIETALTMTKDNRAMAAQLLGLSRQSLYVKLRRFGMGGLEPSDADLH